MTRLCLLLVGFAQALAWGPTAPMLRSSFAQQASLRSVRGQRTLTNLKMDAGRDVSVDRRGTISLFTLGLVSLLSPAQSWADGKSSTELQKEVANLEREVRNGAFREHHEKNCVRPTKWPPPGSRVETRCMIHVPCCDR